MGELRLTAMRGLSIDTFDAARSGERSLTEVLDRTHSRLVAWDDTAAATLSSDLAAGWQQPDPGVYVFTLREDTSWQERPGLPARVVDAEDIATHLQRVIGLAASGQLPQVQRSWDYSSITRIEATDDHTIVVETTTPDPFLLQTLAGPFAFVQRREAVPLLEADGNELLTDHLSGSGSFFLDRQADNGDLNFAASPVGHRPAAVSALHLRPAATGLDALLARELDEFVARDRRDASAAIDSGLALSRQALLEPTPLVSSMHVGSAPWSDENLRVALVAALNRHELAERLFGGRAVPAGLVPPSAGAFAHAPDELAGFPGYRPSYDDDIAEARARFAAADPPAGPLTVDVPVIADSLYALSAVVPAMIRDALGIEVVVRANSYVNISGRVSDGEYGNGAFACWIGWGPPVVGPDPSRSLWEAFHSTSASARESGFHDASVDARLEELVVEFDMDARRSLVRDIESQLLARAAGALVSWVQQQHDVFRQPYVSGPAPDPYGLVATTAALRVDVAHAAYPVSRPD